MIKKKKGKPNRGEQCAQQKYYENLLVSKEAKRLPGLYSQCILYFQGGKLVERRLNQRKWKWIVHGSPKDHQLTSITPGLQDETNEKFLSLFFTTSSGSVFEYRISKQSGE